MFEERFARQYLYEPPPEFPLASPYTGIVHRLSGPNGHAITRIFHRGGIRIGRWCRLIEGLPTTARPIPCLRFHCAFQRASPSLSPRRVEERGLSDCSKREAAAGPPVEKEGSTDPSPPRVTNWTSPRSAGTQGGSLPAPVKRIFFLVESFDRFPLNNFKHFGLSFQSSLHLSLTVLVRYRSLARI